MLTSAARVANGVWRKVLVVTCTCKLWIHKMSINLPLSLVRDCLCWTVTPVTVTLQPQFWLIELRFCISEVRCCPQWGTTAAVCWSAHEVKKEKKKSETNANGFYNAYICKYSSAVKPSFFLSLLTMQSSLVSIEIFIIFYSQILCLFDVKRPGNSTSASSLLQSEVRQMHGKI